MRLQAAASPGEIVIAASTRRLVGRMFDCRALGADETKGLPQPAEAWQVRGETAGVSRFEARRRGVLSPLVGRQEEIELLLRRWDQAKLGEGRVVLLSGEPGIGKSRIAETLLARLEGEPHARLRYFCSPHHTHSPLYPFIAQLERAAGFEPGDDAGAKLDKLEALLKPTARNVPRDVALIAELLGVPADGRYPALAVSPQQKREMTLTALLDQLDGVAAQSPVLIVFEDAHWIDPTSLDLLDRTVARVANLPVLLVVTVRPELQPTWVGEPHVTMLPLSRLGRRDSAGIIGGVTRDKALPDAVVEQVLAHTDGVPLFVEELTSTLLESGLLRETPDRYVLDGPLPPLAIPTTLQASLVARLDRLASVKDVAQIGAAIGREFSHELIAAVSALAPMDLDAALERLTGLRPHLPARNAAGRDLLVQARAGTGRRLRHDAQEPAAAVACGHRQSAGRAVPGDGRKPARGRRPPFHRGRACQRGDRLLGQGGSACLRAMGQPRGCQILRAGAASPRSAAGEPVHAGAGLRAPSRVASGAEPTRRRPADVGVSARGRGSRRAAERRSPARPGQRFREQHPLAARGAGRGACESAPARWRSPDALGT